MNTKYFQKRALFLALLFSPTLLFTQLTPAESVPDTNNRTALPLEPQVSPDESDFIYHKEVKVKDPLSKRRFWLTYNDRRELMDLRKEGFQIIKTREVRKRTKNRQVSPLLRDFLLLFAREGARLLMNNNGSSGNNSPPN